MASSPSIVVRAHAGRINRRLAHAVVEIDHHRHPVPWETEVEISIDAGTHEVLVYLVLADTPHCTARAATCARALVEIIDGCRRSIDYRPSRLFSGAWHGKLSVSDAES